MRYLAFFLATVSLSLATDICAVSGVGSGICISPSTCSQKGGKSYSGHCSGSDVQCCVNIPCKTTGLCMRSSECAGTTHSGACPGPNGFTCCTDIPCDNKQGTCMPRSSCTKGTPKTGMCPGSSDYVCCVGSKPPTPTPGKGDKIVKAAASMIGKYPYSWDAGDIHGATKGAKEPSKPYCDDRNVVGFDCSGLAIYAVYQGTGKSLPHRAKDQYSEAPKYPLSERQPGDLIFYGSSASNIHHVAIYAGNNKIIEAPGHDDNCKGLLVKKSDMYKGDIMKTVGRFY